ncbi:hypothetical protein PISMIDRAFT_690005, partial [Pisolithus microcarpus 441]
MEFRSVLKLVDARGARYQASSDACMRQREKRKRPISAYIHPSEREGKRNSRDRFVL